MDPEKVKVQAVEFFNKADVDKNGSIDFSEWSAATINKSNLLNDKNLKECFKMFDRDGGGSISAQEVGEILGGATNKDNKIWREEMDFAINKNNFQKSDRNEMLKLAQMSEIVWVQLRLFMRKIGE